MQYISPLHFIELSSADTIDRRDLLLAKKKMLAELELNEAEVVALVVENSGVPARMVRTALSYWASHPSEIDAEIALADDAETAAELAWRHERDLLSR